MKIQGKQEGPCLTVYLSGELDHHAARQAMREISRLIDDALPRQCLLDLSGLSFMDSSGLAVILSTHRHMAASGGSASVVNPPAQTRRVLEAAGIERLVQVIERK